MISVALRKKASAVSLVTMSFMLALAVPAASVNAQSQISSQQSLEQFKQRVNTAIDNSLAKLKESQQALNFSISANKDGVNASVTGPGGGTASGSISRDGASGSVSGANGGSASGSVSRDGASGQATTSNGSSASGSVTKDGAASEVNGANGGSASSSINKDGSSASITGPGGGSASIDAKSGTLTGSLSVPGELKDKLKAANQKAIDKLNDLKEEVNLVAKMEDLQAKAKEFDAQFKEIAVATVQATVTKSIDSVTYVLDRLQLAANSIETQIAKIKECIQSGSIDADVSKGSGSASANVSITAPNCSDLNVAANAGDMAASLEEQLEEARSTMKTIRSFLAASISLVSQLKDGNYTGTVASFQGISSQVDIVFTLSANVQNILVNLSSTINK